MGTQSLLGSIGVDIADINKPAETTTPQFLANNNIRGYVQSFLKSPEASSLDANGLTDAMKYIYDNKITPYYDKVGLKAPSIDKYLNIKSLDDVPHDIEALDKSEYGIDKSVEAGVHGALKGGAELAHLGMSISNKIGVASSFYSNIITGQKIGGFTENQFKAHQMADEQDKLIQDFGNKIGNWWDNYSDFASPQQKVAFEAGHIAPQLPIFEGVGGVLKGIPALATLSEGGYAATSLRAGLRPFVASKLLQRIAFGAIEGTATAPIMAGMEDKSIADETKLWAGFGAGTAVAPAFVGGALLGYGAGAAVTDSDKGGAIGAGIGAVGLQAFVSLAPNILRRLVPIAVTAYGTDNLNSAMNEGISRAIHGNFTPKEASNGEAIFSSIAGTIENIAQNKFGKSASQLDENELAQVKGQIHTQLINSILAPDGEVTAALDTAEYKAIKSGSPVGDTITEVVNAVMKKNGLPTIEENIATDSKQSAAVNKLLHSGDSDVVPESYSDYVAQLGALYQGNKSAVIIQNSTSSVAKQVIKDFGSIEDLSKIKFGDGTVVFYNPDKIDKEAIKVAKLNNKLNDILDFQKSKTEVAQKAIAENDPPILISAADNAGNEIHSEVANSSDAENIIKNLVDKKGIAVENITISGATDDKVIQDRKLKVFDETAIKLKNFITNWIDEKGNTAFYSDSEFKQLYEDYYNSQVLEKYHEIASKHFGFADDPENTGNVGFADNYLKQKLEVDALNKTINEVKINIESEVKNNQNQVTEDNDLFYQLDGKPSSGTHHGAFWTTAAGEKIFAKSYVNPKQSINEVLAAKIYKFLGIPVPETNIHIDDVGNKVIVSKRLEGNDVTANNISIKEAKDFSKNVVWDMFFGNWDVAGGQYPDNAQLFKGTDGKIYRLDHGGNLLFRAVSGEKTPEQLNNLTEIKSFFDEDINPSTAKILKKAGINSAYDLLPQLKTVEDKIADIAQKYGSLKDWIKSFKLLDEGDEKKLYGALVNRWTQMQNVIDSLNKGNYPGVKTPVNYTQEIKIEQKAFGLDDFQYKAILSKFGLTSSKEVKDWRIAAGIRNNIAKFWVNAQHWTEGVNGQYIWDKDGNKLINLSQNTLVDHVLNMDSKHAPDFVQSINDFYKQNASLSELQPPEMFNVGQLYGDTIQKLYESGDTNPNTTLNSFLKEDGYAGMVSQKIFQSFAPPKTTDIDMSTANLMAQNAKAANLDSTALKNVAKVMTLAKTIPATIGKAEVRLINPVKEVSPELLMNIGKNPQDYNKLVASGNFAAMISGFSHLLDSASSTDRDVARKSLRNFYDNNSEFRAVLDFFAAKTNSYTSSAELRQLFNTVIGIGFDSPHIDSIIDAQSYKDWTGYDGHSFKVDRAKLERGISGIISTFYNAPEVKYDYDMFRVTKEFPKEYKYEAGKEMIFISPEEFSKNLYSAESLGQGTNTALIYPKKTSIMDVYSKGISYHDSEEGHFLMGGFVIKDILTAENTMFTHLKKDKINDFLENNDILLGHYASILENKKHIIVLEQADKIKLSK